jgi:hypothetical protein
MLQAIAKLKTVNRDSGGSRRSRRDCLGCRRCFRSRGDQSFDRSRCFRWNRRDCLGCRRDRFQDSRCRWDSVRGWSCRVFDGSDCFSGRRCFGCRRDQCFRWNRRDCLGCRRDRLGCRCSRRFNRGRHFRRRSGYLHNGSSRGWDGFRDRRCFRSRGNFRSRRDFGCRRNCVLGGRSNFSWRRDYFIYRN